MPNNMHAENTARRVTTSAANVPAHYAPSHCRLITAAPTVPAAFHRNKRVVISEGTGAP